MSRQGHIILADRVAKAAAAAFAADATVSPIDVLMGIGWIDYGTVQRWRQGQIECLEQAIQTKPERIAEALGLLRSWAADKGLVASLIDYVVRTPQRQDLRFSRSGSPALEEHYRTHWVSGELSRAKRAHLAEKASRVPELVVVQPLNREWKCHRCGGGGDLLMMENRGPACLDCVGLGDLAFLPAGNALLTRRAKAQSKRSAVVVRFSRSRRRYERQGMLVEAGALEAARREIEATR
ncbi:MAG TPA: hypothetical protein VGF43_04755 [Dongiaceae bacterium]|jgi:hypothetical protein